MLQSYLDASRRICYAMALPIDTSADVIGQIVEPTNATWVGFDFGTTMAKNLLVVAWAHEGEAVASIRLANGYTAPSEYLGTASVRPIANDTFVNSTHFSYTYLCSGCVTESSSLTNSIGAFG